MIKTFTQKLRNTISTNFFWSSSTNSSVLSEFESLSHAKKKAFTLAEVLITIGIIGIVSAITLPTLITNYQKRVYVNKLKQTVAIISQGLRTYIAEESSGDLTERAYWNESEEGLNTFVKKYFKVARDCNGKYIPCFASTQYTSLSGNNKFKFTGHCNVIVTLINGTALCMDSVRSENSSYADEDPIEFEIDVNGPAGPNRIGVDFFSFSAKKDGSIYDYWYEENPGLDYYARWTGTGALGQIMADGWKITYPTNGKK
jgi:prepilin-type N-terminal cleavage/methylation domain-containing protein